MTGIQRDFVLEGFRLVLKIALPYNQFLLKFSIKKYHAMILKLLFLYINLYNFEMGNITKIYWELLNVI